MARERRARALSVLVGLSAVVAAITAADCGGATAVDGSATSAAGRDAGTDSSAGDRLGVDFVDASDGACPYRVFGLPPLFGLTPDAAPRSCAFTEADVACNSDSDCTVTELVSCGCYNFVVGVSTSNTAVCPPPPCLPPDVADPCASGSGWVTQDCNVIAETSAAKVICANHRCVTRSE